MIFGLILAGGRSSRFGRDKATAKLGGEPLIAWVSEALRTGTHALAVSAPLASPAAAFALHANMTCLPDPAGSTAGPLTGVREGLRWVALEGGDGLVTAPCDLPFLPRDYVRRLVEAGAKGCAVVRTPDGLEPLCALWSVSALATLDAVNGHPPVRDLLRSAGAVDVAFAETADFANLNTPEDFAAAERRMAER